MTSNLIGHVILERYRVDAFIEAGGMGVVYRIWDLTRSVPLAMKVLHEDLSEDPTVWKMFQREADALSKLTHPRIVPFYGLFQTPTFSFFLEYFVDGESLKHLLQKQKGIPLTIREALTYLKALSSALGYAHYNGIIHCDIKPGNVLIDHGGNIFLTDFGIARHAHSTTTTMAGAGTPAYMAPEQIRGEPVTPSADVYALGVMLYELLTGRRPFLGNEPESEPYGPSTDQRIFFAQMNLTAPDSRSINPKIPPALSSVVMKSLEKSPGERYASMQEFFNAACQAAGEQPEAIPDRLTPVHDGSRDTVIFTQPPQQNYIPPATMPFPAAPGMQQGKKKSLLPVLLAAAGGVILLALAAMIIFGVLWFRNFNPSITVNEDPVATPEVLSARATATKGPEKDNGANLLPSATAAAKTPVPSSTRAATKTPTARPFATVTAALVQDDFRAPLYTPLQGCAASHIHKGDWTMITYGGGHNAIRSTPDTHPTDNKVGVAEEGELMRVIDGPECNYGWLLWKVRTASGLEGWTPETNGKEFWIEPFPTWEACRGSQKSLLHKDDEAQVTLFPPMNNRVRSAPDTNAERIASLDPGVKLNIIDGPHCSNGVVWWKIQAGSVTGWTAEGQGDEYFLVPVPKPHP